jgi:DNA-binding NarL/FixJ family response regulator
MANPSTVYLLAREVYRNRNARGAPPQYRAAVKAAIRPMLQRALKDARTARDCYQAGDSSTAGQAMMLARYWIQKAKEAAHKSVAGRRNAVWADYASGRKKLTDAQEKKIIDLVSAGTMQKTVADQFGVSTKTVSRLVNSKQG